MSSRKGIADRRVEGLPVADLAHGLERGGKVVAVVGKNRRPRSDLRVPGRCVGIDAEMIVEPPDRICLA